MSRHSRRRSFAKVVGSMQRSADHSFKTAETNPDAFAAFVVFMLSLFLIFGLCELFARFKRWRNKPQVQRLEELIKSNDLARNQLDAGNDDESIQVLIAERKALELQRRKLKFWNYYLNPYEDIYEGHRAEDQITFENVFAGIMWAIGIVFFIVLPCC